MLAPMPQERRGHRIQQRRLSACPQVALVVCAAVGCGSPQQARQEPPQQAPQVPTVSSIPELPPPTVRTEGPLSQKAQVPETPALVRHELSERARSLYLDGAALQEDSRAFLSLVEKLFVAPPTPELATRVQHARRDTQARAWRAPASLDSIFLTFLGAAEGLPLCARPPGDLWHCFGKPITPPPPGGPPFELSEPAPGIAKLVIRDLTNAADPAWASFAAALDQLASARGLVLDLRHATGADPRPLVPLLERLTGRAPFQPLRAIHRRPELEPYIADYASRFMAEARDRAAWEGLVGAMPPSSTATPVLPISVIVGDGCGAACELAARSLMAYAGATLFGRVQQTGRLERDDPARLVLPRSKVELYFLATEYLLDATIERVTGPTAQWGQRVEERSQLDLATFAARELEQHLAGKRQPRCDAFASHTDPDRLPTQLQRKLRHPHWLGRSCRHRIRVQTTAPLSAVRRFAATCTPPISLRDMSDGFLVQGAATLPGLSQLVQGGLIERIDIDCWQEERLLD